MGRKAFVSKHIVLSSNSSHNCNIPVYGIILVENEIIFDVVIFEKSVQVRDVIEKFYD